MEVLINNYAPSFEDITGLIGGLLGFAAFIISYKQWKMTNRKVAMLTDSGAIFEVLPTWYSSRMVDDYWLFDLQMTGGQIVVIVRIIGVSSDSKWMDVELATQDEITSQLKIDQPMTFAVADDRRMACVQIAGIQTALDLQHS